MQVAANPALNESHAERRVAALCGAGAMALGLAGLVGWVLGSTFLTQVVAGYKAIAPSVAFSFILLGLALWRTFAGSAGRRERVVSAAVVGVISLFGLLEVIGFLAGIDLNLEDTLTGYIARLSAIPFETMSPVAGALLFLVGADMLVLALKTLTDRSLWKLGDTAGVLGLAAAIIAAIFSLGYAYGAPLLYGGRGLPIALTSSLGSLLLAVGTMAAAGWDQWPLRAVAGDSTRARLLRAFVPLTVIVALAISVADHWLAALGSLHHILTASLLTVALTAVAGLLASRVARSIGETIDQAQLAQERAEQALAHEAHLLQTLAENTDAHLVYLDRDFNFIWVNSAYARACRRAKEEFVGHNHFEFYPDAENEAIFRQVRDTGEPARYIEKPFEFPDMPERGVTYWDWTLTPLKNARGEVENLIFSLADVTEKVRTREQLLETERLRAQMAETVAREINHRMKNNLMLVSGVLDLQLNAKPIARDAAEALRQARDRIFALSTVHEQLSAHQSGQVDLSDVLRRISEMAAGALATEEVAVSVNAPSLLVSSRLASTLAVVCNELITNALKYGAPGPDGKRQVAVALSRQDGALRLRVWSSGNPVPTDFDPGQQKGLGLYLCRELVSGELRGSFSIRSDDGGTASEILVDQRSLEGEVGAA